MAQVPQWPCDSPVQTHRKRWQPSGINNFWISGPRVCIDTVAHSAPLTAFCFLNEMLVFIWPMYRVLVRNSDWALLVSRTKAGPWPPLTLYLSLSLTHHLANTGVLLPSLPTLCAALRSEGPGQPWFLLRSFFPQLHCPAVPHTPGDWEDIYQVPLRVVEKGGQLVLVICSVMKVNFQPYCQAGWHSASSA